jgi:hypothetical protein
MTYAAANSLSFAPTGAQADERQKASRRFVHLGFISCLCLQRFGLRIGESALFLCLPGFLLLVLWALRTGRAQISVRAGRAYTILALLFLSSLQLSILSPDETTDISFPSMGAVLVAYVLLAFEPSRSFDTTHTLDIFLWYARLACVLGIAQYALQFVGISFFSFTHTVPALGPVLVERLFAYDPLLSFGSYVRRSNGVFFLEPSMFSQIIVIAVCVDVLMRREFRFAALYAVAYACTFSGTGAMSLAFAMLWSGLCSARGFGRTAAFVVGAVALASLASMVSPEVYARFAGRLSEFQNTESSAYARYVKPWEQLAIYLPSPRALIGYGPGATERSIYFVRDTGNTTVKLLIDYGVLGAAALYSYFWSACARAPDRLLGILCFSIYLLGGGYLLYIPHLVLTAMVCIWSRPSTGGAHVP